MAFKIKDGFMIGTTSIYDSSGILRTDSNLSAFNTTLVTNLNADLLDGQQGTYYLDYNNFTNKPTIPTVNNSTIVVTSGSGLTGSGSFTLNQATGATVTITHATPSTVASNISSSANSFITSATFDSFGHVTAATAGSVDFTVASNYAFQNISISTDSGYTWGTVNTNTTQSADSNTDTFTLVPGTSINLYTNTVGATNAIKIEHADTSTLSGVQGSAGIASITVDGLGHVTAVSTATYLTSYTETSTLNQVTSRGATSAAAITINSNTNSTNTTSGALIVTGGVGIGGTVNIGSALNVGTTLNVTGTSTLAAVTASGIATITNHTNSSSTTSGALQVQGGVGITGSVNVGGDITVGGTATITGNLIVNGTSTIVQSTQISIKDTILWLGGTAGSTAGDTLDKGIIFNYWDGTGATSRSGFFGWDESLDSFAYYQAASEASGVISGTLGTIRGATFVGYLDGIAATASVASKTTAAVTFNTTGGAAAGTTFDGSTARTIDYSTIGAAPLSHSHGNINNDGTLSGTPVTGASGDYLIIADNSNSGKIVASIPIGTATTTFLRNDGTWASPIGTTYTAGSGITLTGTTFSLTAGFGDTVNPYGSKTVNTFLAAPNGSAGSAGTPTFRTIVAADIPTLNQNTIGQAGYVANAVTFNNSGTGDASGTTYNGSATRTISYNTIGGASAGHLHSGTYVEIAGSTMTGALYISNTTASTTPATGSLRVAGGVGITGALTVGATAIFYGEVQDATSNGTIISSTNVSTTPVSTVSTTVIDSFDLATYRSGKYVVQITQGTNYQVSEILVIHNGTTTNMTEYAVLETNAALGTLTSVISPNGANVELLVTMGSATAATIKVNRVLMTV